MKYFDGPNDGLVSEKFFPWGEKFTRLSTEGRRGIFHGDMIDLNWENISGFDVRVLCPACVGAAGKGACDFKNEMETAVLSPFRLSKKVQHKLDFFHYV